MKEKLYKNQYGKIPTGTKVSFIMENQDQWGGNNIGILLYEDEKWFIRTTRSGDINIGGYLEAYPNTIRPID